MVVERTTSAFPMIQSMTSTEMAIRPLDTCTALNMKCTNTTETLSREISIIMKYHASSASSSHVVQCWWCPLRMTVRLDGSRSIMGIWWLHVITTSIQPTSFVLTGIQSMFLVAMPTRMVVCCTLLKEFVVHSRVFLMSAVESWHALCVPSDWKIPVTVAWLQYWSATKTK